MNTAIQYIAHRAAGLMPGHSRMRVGFAANEDSPTALHKLTGSLLWGLLLVLVCLGSASSDANTPPPGQLVASFVYNPSGLRIEKQGERGVERFTYDEQSLLQAYDENNTTLAKYDYGAERLVSLTSSSEPVQFYLTDALNSVVNLTNSSGAVQARYQYDAWGLKRSESGSSWNRFAFTGYVEDKETDLLYAKARYYDSDTGRFLSQDAWEGSPDSPPSLNKYLYAYQNPTVFVDSSGNIIETVWDVANVVMGVKSFADNVRDGNYGSAAIDAVGVVADAASVIVPGVPGGVGTAIKVGREGTEMVVDTARNVDKAKDAAKAAEDAKDLNRNVDNAVGSTNNNNVPENSNRIEKNQDADVTKEAVDKPISSDKLQSEKEGLASIKEKSNKGLNDRINERGIKNEVRRNARESVDKVKQDHPDLTNKHGRAGTKAHKEFEEANKKTNERYRGTGYEVKSEEFRDKAGEVTSRRAQGSKGLDAIIKKDGENIHGMDLKTGKKGFSESDKTQIKERFEIETIEEVKERF